MRGLPCKRPLLAFAWRALLAALPLLAFKAAARLAGVAAARRGGSALLRWLCSAVQRQRPRGALYVAAGAVKAGSVNASSVCAESARNTANAYS
ncbi:hypothetical protein NPIL_510631 [Nephila pilipes]|uniref:Secreted protein n=1 Tax=Nephila pilipes TaxID=299642 RepID=A0A8X6NZW9_NEPPI|nr:hypothetical protein NPIL_510631 [Nephila pilipes]